MNKDQAISLTRESQILNFDQIIDFLMEAKQAGINAFIDFKNNITGEEVRLYSADVTLDSAYLQVFGMSKTEFETEFNKIREQISKSKMTEQTFEDESQKTI